MVWNICACIRLIHALYMVDVGDVCDAHNCVAVAYLFGPILSIRVYGNSLVPLLCRFPEFVQALLLDELKILMRDDL